MLIKDFITFIHFKLFLSEEELTFIIGRFSFSLLKLKENESKYFSGRSLINTDFMDKNSPLCDLINIIGIWSNERKSRMSIELQVIFF